MKKLASKTSPKKKVNLFIVGGAKCGTTSLAKKLSEHPEVSLGRLKEPFYFLEGYGISSYKEYEKLYNWDKTWQLDASTGYLFGNKCAENIYNYNPNAKIIIIIRNPIKLVVSYWKYMKANGLEKYSFERAISKEEQKYRKSDKFISKCEQWPGNYWYLDRAKFSSHIIKYIDLFGSNNVYIGVFEELVKNENTLSEIYQFIGINAPNDLTIPKENISGVANPLIKFIRFSSVLRPLKIIYKVVTPKSFKYKIRNELFKKSMISSKKEEYSMPRKIKKCLINHYRDDYLNLKQYFPTLNLSTWTEFEE